LIVTVYLAVRFQSVSNDPPSSGEAIAIKGELEAARGLNVAAFRESLPQRLRNARQLLVVFADRVTCPACSSFSCDLNRTGLPGLFVTQELRPGEKPDLRTMVMPFDRLRGVPEEVGLAEPFVALFDFSKHSISVAPGTHPSWSLCLAAIRRDQSYSTQNL
jgi:hypothetical protein